MTRNIFLLWLILTLDVRLAVAYHLIPLFRPSFRLPVAPFGFLYDMVVECGVLWRLVFDELTHLSGEASHRRVFVLVDIDTRRTAVAAVEYPHQLALSIGHLYRPLPNPPYLFLTRSVIGSACGFLCVASVGPHNPASQTGVF